MAFKPKRKATKADLIRQIVACTTPASPPHNLGTLQKETLASLKTILKRRRKAYLEEWFLHRINRELSSLGLRIPGRDKTHLAGSDLEFDFSWKSIKLAIEIQGGLNQSNSGHRTSSGVRRDILKMCLAQTQGWLLLQLTPENVKEASVWKMFTLPLIRKAVHVCRERSERS